MTYPNLFLRSDEIKIFTAINSFSSSTSSSLSHMEANQTDPLITLRKVHMNMSEGYNEWSFVNWLRHFGVLLL